METAEAPVQNEVRPPDSIETKVYGEGKEVVNLTCARFTNGGGNEVSATENKVKSKSMVVFPMGWPWDASAKTTHDFPGQVAKGLDATTFAISTRSQRDNTEGRALQGNAMYQYLLDNGLDKETQLFIIGHSEGAIKGAYLTKTLEDNGFKPALFVVVSPMGLNSRSPVGLLKDFIKDTFITGKKERQKGGVRAGDKHPFVEKVPEKVIQEEFRDSLKKKYQTGGILGLWSQIKGLVTEDPIFSQLKVPIVDLANDKDKVSDHRSYLPLADEKITGADARTRQDERVRLAKAREILARQKFKESKAVKVVIPTRQADHNGIPVVRGEQVPSLIKRVISLAERAAKKAA